MDQIIEWLRTQDKEGVYELLRGIFMQGAVTALAKVEFDNEDDGERTFTEIEAWLDADKNILVKFTLEEIDAVNAE